MPEITSGEQELLEQIRRGSQHGWSGLVDRYQGRLLAFARSRFPADADDLVQETFVQFLKTLPQFRGEASVETYLFMILRRRIIDAMRGRRVSACLVNDDASESDNSTSSAAPAAADPTASRYARRTEQVARERAVLLDAMRDLVNRMKEAHNFRDLEIAEALFYGQLRNKEIASLVGIGEKQVALIKHRWLKDLHAAVRRRLKPDAPGEPADPYPGPESLLTQIWEEHRLSCPKRSTLGGFVLGTLERPWHEYIDFHAQRLGCRFCRANLDDLRAETQVSPRTVRDRVMQSTIGFFERR